MEPKGISGAGHARITGDNMKQHATTPTADGKFPEFDALLARVVTLCTAVEQLLEKKQYDDGSVLTTDELAEALKISTMTIWRYRKLGMPELTADEELVEDGLVRYRYGAVLAWLSKKPKRRRRPR